MLQHIASLIGAIVLAVISQVLTPPVKLPDLYTLLITTYSFVHFAAFLLYFHYLQFTAWRGLAASARFCWINLDDHVCIWVWFIPSFLVAFSFCIDALLLFYALSQTFRLFSQVLSENKNNKKHNNKNNNNKNWEKVRLEVFLKRTRYGFRVMSIFISVLGTMSKCHASKIKNLHNKLWNSNGGWFQTCWLMQDSPCLQNMNIEEALKQFITLAEFWVGIYTLSIWPNFFEYSLSFVHSNWNCANGCVWGCVCVLHLQLVHFIRLAMRRSPERAFTWPVLDIQQDFFIVSVWSMPTPSSEKMGRAVRRVTDYGGYCSSYVNFRKTQLCFQSHSKLGCVFLLLLNLSADWGQADPGSPPVTVVTAVYISYTFIYIADFNMFYHSHIISHVTFVVSLPLSTTHTAATFRAPCPCGPI